MTMATAIYLAYIWFGCGFVTISCVNFMDWYEGTPTTTKEIFWTTIAGSLVGCITLLIAFPAIFQAIYCVINSLLSPLNFKLKGRKQ